jgi:hypothetical protein
LSTSLIFSVGGQAATVFTALAPEQLWTVVKGAFMLWKHLKGSPPANVQNQGNTCNVTNNSGQIIQVRTDSVNLVFNEKATDAVSRCIKTALEADGYDRLEINSEDGEIITSVNKQEAVGFGFVGKEGVLSDNVARMILSIVAPVFQDGNKWRFHDGERSFSAAILDGDFLMKVNQGERFGKGDLLDVDMRVLQNGIGLKTNIDRHIVKVHRHVVPQEQTTLL